MEQPNGTPSSRNGPAELPAVAELRTIFELEAPRPARVEKMREDPTTSWGAVTAWLEAAGCDPRIFHDPPRSWEETLTAGSTIQPELVARTLAQPDALAPVLSRVTSYLAEEDAPQPCDVIMVFGGRSMARVERGIELWRSGIAPKLLLSGGHPVYRVTESEARIYERAALAAGVPADALIIEPDSITMPDNVKRSLNLLDASGTPHGRMLLVTSWYPLRRAVQLVHGFTDPGTEIQRVASAIDPEHPLSTSRWAQSADGISLVFNEFVKMRTMERFALG